MAICLGVPYLDYEEIRRYADGFLLKYHPKRTVPVPIGLVVERDLQLEVRPIYNLLRDYGRAGYLTSDGKEIAVDQFIMARRPNLYYFTLAHEVGHLFMHAQLYEKLHFDRASEWKKFQQEVSGKSISRLDWQAHCFAGLVLVPKERLAEAIAGAGDFTEQRRKAEAKSISFDAYENRLRKVVARTICGQFGVSAEVIERRIDLERIVLSAP